MLPELFRRRTVFLLFMTLLCALGIVLALQLPIQLYPQTQRPRVRIRLSHEGFSAVDFSRQYGEQIEARLMTIQDIDILEVEYQNDDSTFGLTFNWSVDSEEAKADVEAMMNSIRSILPEDLRDSYSVRFSEGENAGFLLLGLRSSTLPPETLFNILKVSLESELTQVEDAETVDILNIEDLEVEVELRPEDMLAYGLTIDDVDAAMRRGHLPEPIGNLEEGNREYTVRFHKEIDSIHDVGRIVVAEHGNISLRLQDIADISISYTLPSQALVIEGQTAIRINAAPKDGGNIRQMTEDIVGILTRARDAGVLPADTEFQLYVDPAEYINNSIRNVVRSALLGAGMAMSVVLLALGELRNTLLIGISLPLTLVLSFILLYVFDVSLNLISLGGIALAVGMVIDSSIVVMENIHRHYEENRAVPDRRSLRNLIIGAVGQVRSSVVASTVTTVLVFLPISFTAPLTNAILGDQAKAVVFALVFALLVALLVLPVIALGIYRPKMRGNGALARKRGLARISGAGMSFLTAVYRKVLRAVIRKKWRAVLMILLSFGFLAFSLFVILPLIPKEIISPPSSDRIVIFFRSNETTDRIEIVENVVPQIERTVTDTIGDAAVDMYAMVSGRFNILFIILRDSRTAEAVLGDLQRAFVSDSTYYFNVNMWDPAQLPLPRTNDLQLGVRGDDDATVVAILEEVRDLVNESDFYARVYTDPPTGLSDELSMTARTEVIDGFPQYSSASLTALVRRILRGTSGIEFEEEQQTVSVSAYFPEEVLSGREQLENFLIPTDSGIVPLKHFFDFRETSGVAGIASENGERIFRVYARMPNDSPAADRPRYEMEIRRLLDEKLSLPPGYSVVVENPQAELDEAIRSLFVALGVSVALIYLVVAFQFNSLLIPLVILVTVPLGFIGVAASLYLFGSTLSLNSMLGTILLAGIVVNNAIILIDFYHQLAGDYPDKIDALVATAGLRFPPILITTLTTILGMLPLAIGLGEGSNIVQPLGIAVSGGLLISTLFTLFVIPGILSFMKKPGEDGEAGGGA